MCLGHFHLWYNATYLHGNALGMCKVGSSLQTTKAYRADMLSFYLKMVWVTSVFCATSEAGAWQTNLTSQNRRGTRWVVSADFLLQTALDSDAERAESELSCLWTRLSLPLLSEKGESSKWGGHVWCKSLFERSWTTGVSLNLYSAQITAEFALSNLWRVLVWYSPSETTSRKHSRKFILLKKLVSGDPQC